MKKLISALTVTAVLLLAAGGAAFAEGAQEDARPYRNFPTEEVTLTGTVDFTVAHTVLKTGDGEWELMYPRMWAEDIDIQDGARVTVTGYEVPGPYWNGEEDERYLRVVAAEIDGETYEIPWNNGPMMGGYGPGRGGMMHHGYGPAYGPRSGGRGWR